MGTIPEALLALQELDTAIDQHRHRRGSLPERAEVATVDASIEAAGRAREEVAARRHEVSAAQKTAETELAATEERIATIEGRMRRGEAGGARDVAAVTTNLEHLRERASQLEDDVLTAMEEGGPLDEQIALVDGETAALVERRDAAAAALTEAEAAIDDAVAGLTEARDAARQAVGEGELAIYDALRKRMGGVAVARLVGTRCDGCHLTLPASELDRIKREPPDALVYCDQCGRVLVRPAGSAPPT